MNDAQPDVPWWCLRGERVFLSGGTGFVGTSLLESYVQAWDEHDLGGTLTVLTRAPGKLRDGEPKLSRHPALRILQGDLASFELPSGPVDTIIHSAVEYGNPAIELQSNLLGTMRVLQLARERRARRVLFVSSGAVYGPQPPDLANIPEDHLGGPPLHPSSAYAEAKRASELLGMIRGESDGFDFLIARCFAFMGKRLPVDKGSAAGQFVGQALRGGPIVVRGDGTPVRSYMDVTDLARWLWTILLHGKHGRPYNVGSEEPITIRQLAERVRDVVAPGVEVQVLGEPTPGAPRQRYVPSTVRARTELGLQQTVSLDESIRNTAAWHRERST